MRPYLAMTSAYVTNAMSVSSISRPDGVDSRLELGVGLAPRDGLGAEEEQAPAVERGERQQVERAEVRAQHAEEVEVARRGRAWPAWRSPSRCPRGR